MDGPPIRRRLLFRAALVLTGGAGLVAACGGTPASPAAKQAVATPATAPKPGATTVPPTQPQAATGAQRTIKANTRATDTQKFMQHFGKEFEQANPGVKVVIEEIPEQEYFTKMRALGAAKQAGDIIWGLIGGGAWLTFAAVGMLRPIDDLVKKEKDDFLKQWYPATHGVATLDGKLYGLPEMSTPGNALLIWNETAFTEAGVAPPTPEWNFEKDFLVATEKLTKRTGDRVERFGTVLMKTYLGLVPMLRRWGGELLNPDGTKCLLDSPENVKAVQFIHDLETKHKVAPTAQQIEENALKMFIGGKVATQANIVPATIATSKKAVGDRFKFSGMLTPRGPAGRATMLAAHHFGINTTSKVADDAWELIKLWGSHEVGVQKVFMGGASPGARPDVYNDPRLHEFDPVYKLAAVAMDNLQPHFLPHNVRGTEMSKVLDNEMDKIWLGKVDVAAGIKNATAQVQKVLDKPRQ